LADTRQPRQRGHDRQPVNACTYFWHEPTGLTAFDDALDHLLFVSSGRLGTPLVRESGPIEPCRSTIRPVPTGREFQRPEKLKRLEKPKTPDRLTRPGEIQRARVKRQPKRPTFRLDMSGTALVSHRWRPGRLPLALLESLTDPGLNQETWFRWRQSTGLLVELPGGWTIYQRTIVDSDRALDPTSRMKEFHQISATVEIPTAVVRYRNRGFQLQVGRRWRSWGPGWTGSLILDHANPSADGIDLSYQSRRWSARYACLRLDDFEPGLLPEANPLSRYLSCHRLDLQPTATLRLGLSETALVAADGAPPFWLLNPVLPWSLAQQEDGSGAAAVNILWAIDATWNPYPGWAVYGQFLLDDFQIDQEDRHTYPDQLGWLGGILWQARPAGSAAAARCTRLGAGLEYTRLGTWTYVHRDPAARYHGWGASLGHPAGPDSETLSGFFEVRQPGQRRRLLLLARWQRQGRIHLGTAESYIGQTDQPFPAPPVSESIQLGAVVSVGLPYSCVVAGRVSRIDFSPTGEGGWFSALVLTCPFWTWGPRHL